MLQQWPTFLSKICWAPQINSPVNNRTMAKVWIRMITISIEKLSVNFILNKFWIEIIILSTFFFKQGLFFVLWQSNKNHQLSQEQSRSLMIKDNLYHRDRYAEVRLYLRNYQFRKVVRMFWLSTTINVMWHLNICF